MLGGLPFSIRVPIGATLVVAAGWFAMIGAGASAAGAAVIRTPEPYVTPSARPTPGPRPASPLLPQPLPPALSTKASTTPAPVYRALSSPEPLVRPGTPAGVQTPRPVERELPGGGRVVSVPGGRTAAGGNVTYNLVFPVIGGAQAKELSVRLHSDAENNDVQISLQGGAAVAAPVAVDAPDQATSYVPAPRAARPRFPLVRQVALEAGAAFVSETYQQGAVDLSPGLVPRGGFSLHYDVGADWFVGGRFRYMAYTITDRQAPESQHHRDEFLLEAGAGYYLPVDFARMAVGLGYWARQVSVANNFPLSLSTPFVASPSQFYQGPRLFGLLQRQLAPDIRLDLEAGVVPFAAVSGDAAVSAISPVFGLGLAPGLSWRFAPELIGSLAYQLDYLGSTGVDFSHVKHGPTAALSWRF